MSGPPPSPERDLDQARRFFADELGAAGGIERQEVLDAFAKVPREHFLGPGPWKLGSLQRGYQETPDADPRRVYHNVVVAIDEARLLNNGQPSFLGFLIDESEAREGDHVVHVGCGTGYYSAILAELVGERGQVTAIELDQELAERAKANLAYLPQVDVVCADGTVYDPGAAEVILVNAGATHPLPLWVDRLLPGGRLIVPLTAPQPVHGAGGVLKVTREKRGLAARFIAAVGIFPCIGARDEALAVKLKAALEAGPAEVAKVQSLRSDAHEEGPTCFVHGPDFCLSTEAIPG